MKEIDTGWVEGFAGEVEGVPCGMESYWPTL